MFFVSFLIVSLTPFINNPDSSRGLTIFIISFISSLEYISAVKPDTSISLWKAVSLADAAAVNPNCIKTLLANGLSTFPVKTNPVFSNVPKSLSKNHPDCHILCNWNFDNYILAEELFGKALRSFKTCVLANDNLCRKLFLS